MEEILKQLIDFTLAPLYAGLTVFVLTLFVILVQLFILIFWKKTQGKVVESYLDEKAGKKKKLFRPVIKYSYLYDGVQYQGQSGWVMREASSNRFRMQRIVDKNKPGNTITVLVNPLNHSHSALPYDVKPFHWVLIFLLLGSGIFTIIIWTKWV